MDKTEKEKLIAIIDKLSERSLWVELTPDEKSRLDLAQSHLHGILLKEADAEIVVENEEKRKRKNARGRGKQTEYRCAKDMGGVVVGRSKAVRVGGEYVQVNCQQPPDVLAPPFFSFECKNRKFPKSVSKAMSQATANAPEGWDAYVWWYDKDSEVTYIITTRPVFLGQHGA